MITIDSETCGLVGPMVLLQYYEGDYTDHLSIDKVQVHHIFKSPISDTLSLIEHIVSQSVVGFNLVYDWFHLTKIYNLLRALGEQVGTSACPIDYIDELIKLEATNPSTYCLRPVGAYDLMLHARRGPYQAAMKRKDITIRRVPKIIAPTLAEELVRLIPMDELYFSRKPYQWKIKDESEDGNFVNLVCEFSGSTSLRAICHHALKKEKADWPIFKHLIPTELPYKPYGQYGERPWGSVIKEHIHMWGMDQALYYAKQDVVLTAELANYFNQQQINTEGVALDFNDTDSFLACMIGGTRVRGFAIDNSNINGLISKFNTIKCSAPRSAKRVREYLLQHATGIERTLISNTQKKTLEALSSIESSSGSSIASAANRVIEARTAERHVNLLLKLSELDTFHPEFKVIGTRSTRLSGGSDDKSKRSLNPQGIPKLKEFRELFSLAPEGYDLFGGDADSFEVTIMSAVFNDKNLTTDLLSGKKFHALIWADLFDMTYDELLEPKNKKQYTEAKVGTFSWAYGGTDAKVAQSVKVSEEKVRFTLDKVSTRYPGIKKSRDEIYNDFCSMRQPNGIGTAVVWADPKEYVESLLGFRRYFTLENYICKSLFNLARSLSLPLRDYIKSNCGSIKLVRREKEQTVTGALQSALYATAFNIQAANLRQAGNHKIQSTGASITKAFQAELYKLQPLGIDEYKILVMNIHDELLCVVKKGIDTYEVYKKVIQEYRKYVPLLKWEWNKMSSWAG